VVTKRESTSIDEAHRPRNGPERRPHFPGESKA
jgi:hypothetical protein